MTDWVVSRHAGAVEWLARRGYADCRHVQHLELGQVRAGDRVVGTLPISAVAELTARGAHYQHLVVPLSSADRGRELSADELEERGARLEGYTAERVPESTGSGNRP